MAFLEQQLNATQELGEVNLINFVDDSFIIPQNRFKEILKMMIKNKYTFKWYAMIRCQGLDEETVRLMKESGCLFLLLGLESASDIVLESINKRTKVAQYRKGIKLLKDYGIAHLATLFIGFPGETEATVEETYRFIEETKPDFYVSSIWYYDKRTPIHNQREQYDLKGNKSHWSHKSMDSETATRIELAMRQKIKNSISLEDMCDDLLFRPLGSRWGLPQMKSMIGKLSRIFIEKS